MKTRIITPEQFTRIAKLARTYHKEAKKTYLDYYVTYLQTGENDPDNEPYNKFGLSTMGAQAVRMNVLEILDPSQKNH